MKTIDFGIYTHNRNTIVASVISAFIGGIGLGVAGAWIALSYGIVNYYLLTLGSAVGYLVGPHIIRHFVRGQISDVTRLQGSVFGALSVSSFILGWFLLMTQVFRSMYVTEQTAIVGYIIFGCTIVLVGLVVGFESK